MNVYLKGKTPYLPLGEGGPPVAVDEGGTQNRRGETLGEFVPFFMLDCTNSPGVVQAVSSYCPSSVSLREPASPEGKLYFIRRIFSGYVSNVSRAQETVPAPSRRYTPGRSRLRNREMPSVTQ